VQIGPHTIGPGAALAPMAGITNPPFRQLCRELGASLTVTELISSNALALLRRNPALESKSLGRATLPLLDRYKGESPFTVQIFGRDPEIMAEAAKEVVSRGADIVDLNFGCPAGKVVKAGKGAGSALMTDPALLQQIADSVVRAVPVPVSAKIRLGWSRQTINAEEVALRLQDAGVQLLTVHARTRDQVHSGPVDLDALARVCEAVSIPVIGNGGIRSGEDADEMMRRTGCDRVAVGQASRGNPWIFRAIAKNSEPPSLKERIDTCRRHLEQYTSWAGEHRTVREMRKHVAWYLKGFQGAARIRDRINRAESLEAFYELLDTVLH
jgi:tRNA-dihydrouridine synthase B